MKLVTLTSGVGVVTPKDLNYLPEILEWVAATQLTGLKVTVEGDGVTCDIDANGLNAFRGLADNGQVTNGSRIQLTNGLISNKVVTLEFTNSAVQAPDVYANSEETPTKRGMVPSYFQYLKQKAFGGQPSEYDNFGAIAFPSIAAADYLNVEFADGTIQKFERQELTFRLQETQNEVNTPIYILDNISPGVTRSIKSVSFYPVADQTVYIMRVIPAGPVPVT